MDSDFGMNKLNNFPKIYCASLIECKDRRKNIQDEFLNYNIQEINFLLSERQVENDPSVIGIGDNWCHGFAFKNDKKVVR